MKRHELKCPGCKQLLQDKKSHMSCEPCNKNYQVSISKKGLKQFMLVFLPSCIMISTIVVLYWKANLLQGNPNSEVIVGSIVAFGFLLITLISFKIKNELIVGAELPIEK